MDTLTKMITGPAAIEAAKKGAPLFVLNEQQGWIPGGPGALARAQRMDPGSTWIYGVEPEVKTWDQIEVGDKLIQAAYRKPSGCAALGRATCDHAACTEPETVYAVVGKRRAPKGNRLALRHPHGHGCSLRVRADGSLPDGWRLAGAADATLDGQK